jgi:hypothetical protein
MSIVADEPHCPEYQADGVPCETAAGVCAECERAARGADEKAVQGE